MVYVRFLKTLDIKTQTKHLFYEAGTCADLDIARAKHYSELGYCEIIPTQDIFNQIPLPRIQQVISDDITPQPRRQGRPRLTKLGE
jgi:hypothetical protein